MHGVSSAQVVARLVALVAAAGLCRPQLRARLHTYC
jgi:hypothetical protein